MGGAERTERAAWKGWGKELIGGAVRCEAADRGWVFQCVYTYTDILLQMYFYAVQFLLRHTSMLFFNNEFDCLSDLTVFNDLCEH